MPYAHDIEVQRLVEQHPGGLTLEQIAQHLDVTRERVRQIEAKALRKLREAGGLDALRGACLHPGEPSEYEVAR